jgi:acetaldehyde dehydrogenase/alcohol dehydrogenase
VTREHLDASIDELADRALEDQCTTANPRQPLVSELKGLIEDAWRGEVGYTARLHEQEIAASAPSGAGPGTADGPAPEAKTAPRKRRTTTTAGAEG